MKKSQLEKLSISELVALFARITQLSGELTDRNELKEANRQTTISMKIRDELLSRGQEGQLALTGLLEHQNKDVRMCSAMDAIDFAPDKAVPILRQLADDPPDWRSYFVKKTLREWEAENNQALS